MKVKAHLVFPQEILDEVDELAGKRRRSFFIVEATREKLQRERFLRALDKTKGAWSDEAHPDLMEPDDVLMYVREKRGGYGKRMKGETDG